MKQVNADILNKKGWIELKNVTDEDSLLGVARSIGKVIMQSDKKNISTLYPTKEDHAKKGTLSNLYGTNEFPLHTDTAFLNVPVRYMILNTEKESSCGTTVLSVNNLFHQLSEDEMKIARKSIFRLKTNISSYYTSLFFKQMGEEGFRYDLTCMTPFNKSAKVFLPILQNAINTSKLEVIKWHQHKTVLIDNWKMLHGRESIGTDINRELKRIYINTL